MPAETNAARPIVLAGFMGSGKSTVGRRVAAALGRDFVDADDVVVARLGRSIPDIFSELGEDAFRVAEAAVVRDLVDLSPPAVIALGGGALEKASTRALLLERTVLVHLARPFEDLVSSILEERATRPMLVERTAEDIRALYEARELDYALCPLQVDVGNSEIAATTAVLDALAHAGVPARPVDADGA